MSTNKTSTSSRESRSRVIFRTQFKMPFIEDLDENDDVQPKKDNDYDEVPGGAQDDDGAFVYDEASSFCWISDDDADDGVTAAITNDDDTEGGNQESCEDSPVSETTDYFLKYYQQALYPGSDKSVYDLALQIYQLKSKFPSQVTNLVLSSMLTLLHEFLPATNKVPLLMSTSRNPTSTTSSINMKRIERLIFSKEGQQTTRKSRTNDDETITSSFFCKKIDVCENGCVLYFGKKKDLLACDICHKPRFFPCAIKDCAVTIQSSPSPAAATGNCIHNQRRSDGSFLGKPRRFCYYIPLARRLKALVEDPILGKYFLYSDYLDEIQLVERSRNQQTETTTRSFVRDICESSEYRRIMSEFKKGPDQNRRTKWKIGLSIAYDGFKAYKSWSQKSIWAMWCFVLSLPPALRNIPGVGMHLVLLHDLTKGPAEKDLVRSTIAKELKSLFMEGIEVERSPHVNFRNVPDTLKTVSKRCTLKAFVSFYHLDTRGLEKLLCIQGANSTFGCYRCDTFPSIQIKGIRKRLFLGHRRFLQKDDPRRKISGDKRDDPSLLRLHFHEEENQQCPKDVLYQTFIMHAKEAQELNKAKNSIIMCKIKKRKRGKGNNEAIGHNRKKQEAVQGVKDIWPFVLLPYSDCFRQVNFDKMHAIGAVVDHIFQTLGGEIIGITTSFKNKKNISIIIDDKKSKEKRGNKEGIIPKKEGSESTISVKSQYIKVERSIGRFNDVPQWSFTSAEKEITDSRIKSLIYPKSYRNGKIKMIFSERALMKTKLYDTFATAFLPFATIDLGCPGIKRLNFLLHKAAVMLNQVVVDELIVKEALLRVIDLLVHMEGVLPISSNNFIHHELYHIAKDLEVNGPVRNTAMYSAERGNLILRKSLLNVRYPLASILTNHLRLEAVQKRFKEDDIIKKNTDKVQAAGITDDNIKVLCIQDYSIKFHGTSQEIVFTDSEFDDLLYDLLYSNPSYKTLPLGRMFFEFYEPNKLIHQLDCSFEKAKDIALIEDKCARERAIRDTNLRRKKEKCCCRECNTTTSKSMRTKGRFNFPTFRQFMQKHFDFWKSSIHCLQRQEESFLDSILMDECRKVIFYNPRCATLPSAGIGRIFVFHVATIRGIRFQIHRPSSTPVETPIVYKQVLNLPPVIAAENNHNSSLVENSGHHQEPNKDDRQLSSDPLFYLFQGKEKEIDRIFKKKGTEETLFGAFEYFFTFQSVHFGRKQLAKCIWFDGGGGGEEVASNTFMFDLTKKEGSRRRNSIGYVFLDEVSSTGVACGFDPVNYKETIFLIPTHPQRECLDRLELLNHVES